MAEELRFPAARPVMAAGILIRDDAGRVLLVDPTYKDGWDIAGGYVEEGESPAVACAREVLEELGLRLDVGRLLVVDWASGPPVGDRVLWIFDGSAADGVPLDSLTLQADEIGDARYWPVEELDALVPAALARRLHLALEAQRTGAPSYAENGNRTG